MTAWLFLLSIMPSLQPCRAIVNDRIVGEDLARALPEFASIPRDAILSYAPAPGKATTFSGPDLTAVAARYKLAANPQSGICFEWKLEPFTNEKVQAAIRESLKMEDARVEVLATSQSFIPPGKLSFERSGLTAA